MGSLSPWARRLGLVQWRVRLLALWKLLRHPQTPWRSKLVALLVLVYALSPADLLADLVPLFGLLDDALLLPLGMALAVRLAPPALWQAQLREAEAAGAKLPRWLRIALVAAVLWLLLVVALGWGLVALLSGS
jgi:uncharacterized membrane protein YkvA (DUF1232 family)